MSIHIGDLDQRQQERVRAALGEAIAAHFAYPPFYNFRADRALVRPLDQAKRAELAAYVATIGFAPLERMEVDSAELRRYFEGVFLRYLDVNPHLAGPRRAARRAQLRALARTMSAEVQRELLAFLQSRHANFGAARPRVSWATVHAAAASVDRAAIDHNTAVLEAILARTRQQAPQQAFGPGPAPVLPNMLNPDVMTMYGQYLSDMQPEVEARLPAPAPGEPSGSGDDRHVFAQLRFQLEAYIRQAVQSYGLPDRGGDPARALDDLRTSGLVDEANLRVAESILALADRVMARGSASIDEYRQALLLYLLYHRSHVTG